MPINDEDNRQSADEDDLWLQSSLDLLVRGIAHLPSLKALYFVLKTIGDESPKVLL